MYQTIAMFTRGMSDVVIVCFERACMQIVLPGEDVERTLHLAIAAFLTDVPEGRRWLSVVGHKRMPNWFLAEVDQIGPKAAAFEASLGPGVDTFTDLHIYPVRICLLCFFSKRSCNSHWLLLFACMQTPPLKKMTHRLRIDADIAKAAAEGRATTVASQRKAYKSAGHCPFIPSALADPAYRSITHGVDGFELLPVDPLHQVRCYLLTFLC
jgi:hypothetical protein